MSIGSFVRVAIRDSHWARNRTREHGFTFRVRGLGNQVGPRDFDDVLIECPVCGWFGWFTKDDGKLLPTPAPAAVPAKHEWRK